MAVYPRKQTILILVVCILVVGGFAFYTNEGFSGSQRATSDILGRADTISVATSDILPTNSDWKKQFLGASSTSTSLSRTAKKSTPVAEEKLTATDILGRSFITKYGELRQAGLVEDEKSISAVMGQVTAESLSQLQGPKTFSTTDIRISASSTDSLVLYGKTMMSIFHKYMPKQNAAELAYQAFANDDMTQLRLIDPVIAGYRNMLQSLAATSAPLPLAATHISLLDAISMALYNAESFRYMDKDPLRGLSAVSLELVALQNIVMALDDMNRYLLSVGIVITS